MLFAYDTETTGLDFYQGKQMFSYSLGFPSGSTTVHRLDGSAVRKLKHTRYLRQLWDTADSAIVMHNSKFDITATNRFLDEQYEEKVCFHDTYLQSHILQNSHPTHGLKDLAWELAQFPKDDEKAIKAFTDGVNYQTVPEPLMDVYQHNDAFRTILLHEFFYPKIAANPRFLEIYNSELDLVKTTIKMERRGIMLDRKRCNSMIDKMSTELVQIQDDIDNLCGRHVNPRKPADVSWMLFECAGLPVTVTTKTGKPCTRKEILFEIAEQYDHPLLDLLLHYRSWDKGITTFQSYLSFAGSDDIIHPSIHTCEAITARESSRRPNLQNVQKSTTLLTRYPVPARRVFRPRPGFVHIHIDYSGIEMRLLVHYSGEPLLVKILREGGDVHEPAAGIFYGDRFRLCSDKKQRKALRDAAKNANFAIPYGASVKKVAMTLGIPYSEAGPVFADYRATLPLLCGLTQTIIREVKEQGYVETVFGRQLQVPRDKAYVGTNYLIQCTGAEILKRAQRRIDLYLSRTTGGAAQLLLPIHDEIIIEWPRELLPYLNDALRDIRALMVDFPQFNVPLEVEASIATRDWADKREVRIAA